MTSVAIPPAAQTAARGAEVGTAPKRNYARLLEQTWIWSVVGYSVLRFFIAWGAFSEYGANVWIFGLVDVGTAWPYGKSVAVVCKRASRSEWSKLPLPLVAAVTTFFAPYAYLWFAAGSMPSGVRLGMAICVSVLLLAATTGVLAKTRKLRREARDEAATGDLVIGVATTTGTGSSSTADDEVQIIDVRTEPQRQQLVIDLTGDSASINRSSVGG